MHAVIRKTPKLKAVKGKYSCYCEAKLLIKVITAYYSATTNVAAF